MKQFIINLFRKQTPKYGWGIFEQKTWLDKQVEEAMWKRSFFLD